MRSEGAPDALWPSTRPQHTLRIPYTSRRSGACARTAENEKIQQEFAGVTVPEPKTPYHRHSSPGFELDDSSNLGEGHPAAPASSAFDYVMNHGGADFHPDAEAVPDSDGANILADAAGMLANGSSPDRRWTTDSCGGMVRACNQRPQRGAEIG